MPHGTKEESRIDEIIRKGTLHIEECIDDLRAVPADDRDKFHFRAVADLMLAALAVSKEQRSDLEWREKKQLDGDSLTALLLEFLRQMAPEQRLALWERASKDQEARA